MRRFLAAGALLAVVLGTQAQITTFRVIAGAYGTATNWSPAVVPQTNDIARIAITNIQNVTHASGTFSAGPLHLGSGLSTGSLTVSGGTLTYSGGLIASNQSVANLIVAGGNVIVTGPLTVAYSVTAASTGSITNNSGTLTVNGELNAALQNGAGVSRAQVTVNGGTVSVSSNIATANGGGDTRINLNGGVLQTFGFRHAGSAVARELRLNGGTLRATADNGNFLPAAAFSTPFTVLVQNAGARFDTQGFTIDAAVPLRRDGTSTGVVSKTGSGTLTLRAGNTFVSGLVISNGTVRIGTGGTLQNVAGNFVTVLAGATLAISNVNAFGTTHGSALATVLNVNGGTLTGEGREVRLGNINLNGGTVLIDGGSALWGTFMIPDTITVGGSSVSIITNTAAANGTLRPETATVFNVGDVTAGDDLIVHAPLLNRVNNGGPASFTKSGAGSMQLESPANLVNGTVTLAAGRLGIGASSSLPAATLAVASGAVFDVSAFASYEVTNQTIQGAGTVAGNPSPGLGGRLLGGGIGTPGTLTITGDVYVTTAAYTNTFDLTNSLAIGAGVNDLLEIGGLYEPNGSVFRINPLAPLTTGVYRLINYVGTNSMNFDTNVLGNTYRDVWSIDMLTSGQVNLVVGAGTNQALVWSAATSADWDLGTVNWTNLVAGVSDRYYDHDSVLFDDSGANSNVVTITAQVKPAAVTVDSTSNYIFTGTGRISDGFGPLSLVKSGPGSLTVQTTNDFTGGTTVSNGTLALATGASVGTGAIRMAAATVEAAGPAITIANPIQLNSATGTVADAGGSLVLTGAISGPGALLKLGGGTTTVSAANSYTGGTVVSAGTLRQAASGSVGSGAILLGDGATGGSDLAWLFAGGLTATNRVVVSALGSGTVRLGSYAAGTFTTHTAPLDLNRAVTLVDTTGDRTTFNGPISGNPGTITIAGTRVTFGSTSNSFTGQLVVPAGSIYQSDVSNAIPSGVLIDVNGLVRLNGGGTHGVDRLTGTGVVSIIAGGNQTLSLGNAGGSAVFNGSLSNGVSILSLNKEGSGVITLNGQNLFSGNVSVNAGTLALGAAGSISNVATIAVMTGATFDVSAAGLVLRPGQTLRGGGTVAGPVTATATSRVVAGTGGPGGSRETLTFTGSLGLHPTSTNFFNLGSTTNIGGPYNDLIVVAGNLEPSGSVIRVDVEEPLATGTYRLMTYGGAKTSSFNSVADLSISLGRKTAVLDESIPGEINLNVSGGFANLVWLPQTNANWNFTDASWSNTTTLAIDTFYQNDSVLFDDRGAASNVVTLTTTTQPAVVTVDGTSNYAFIGTGRLQGLAALVKSGTGTLSLFTTNTYTGGTRIEGGTVRMGNASALGATAGYLLVTNNGALDINGSDSTYTVNIAGAGLGGQGTVVNSGAGITTGPDVINLTGDASIGGVNRWDVRGVAARLNLNGYTLTKVGSNYIPLVQGTANSGTVEIVSGGFGVEAAAVFTQGQVNVRSGGNLGLYNNSTFTAPVSVFGGRITVWNGSGSVTLQSPLALSNAPATFTPDGGDNLFITNVISGTVGFIVDATTGGGVELAGENTFTGDIVVSNGYLAIGRGGTSGSVGGNVTLVNGSTLYHWRSDALTLSNSVSGAGNFYVRNPSGLTLDGRASVQITGDVRIPWDGFHTYVRIDTGALLSANNIYLGNQTGWNGAVTQHAGLVRATNVVGIGQWGSETSRYFMAGGTLSVTNARLSIGWDGTGIFIQTGGVVTARRAQVDSNGSTPGGSLWIFEGGAFNLIDALDAMGDSADTAYWGGGTIGSLGNWSAAPGFRAILTGTNGNTTLDTAAYTITMTGSVFTGAGGLSKAGAGTLVLTGGGSNQYAGGTALNNGSLQVNNQLVADVTVGAAATLAGTGSVSGVATVTSNGLIQPGTPMLAGALSITSVVLQANAKVNPIIPGTAALLRVTGTNGLVVPAGADTAQINILNVGLTVGTYTLIDYTGAIQGGTETNLVLGSYAPGSVMYLTNNTANTSIDLVIVSLGGAVKWTGLVDGNWNINTTTNWQTELGLLPAAYADDGTLGNAVVFDDTASGNFSVNVTVPVQPVSLRVSNTNNDYTLGGSFPIGGPGSLTKDGPGRLSLTSSNSFAGRTTVAGGTLDVNGITALGAAPAGLVANQLTLANGTVLRASAPLAFETTRGVTVGTAGSLGDVTIDTGINTVTVPQPLLALAGSTTRLVKAGSGTLTLQGYNTHRGGNVVSNGTLALTVGGATGAIRDQLDILPGATVLSHANDSFGYNGAGVQVTTINNAGTILHAGTVNLSVWGVTLNLAGGLIAATNTAGGRLDIGNGAVVNTLANNATSVIAGLNYYLRQANVTHTVADGAADVDLLVTAPINQGVVAGITKWGPGAMALAATNTYTSNTVVDGGTLYVADSGKLYHGGYQATATVFVRSNAVLDLATWAYSEPGAESLGGLRANNNAIVINGGTIRVRKSSSYYRGFTIGAAGATFETTTGSTWTIAYDATTPIVNTAGGSLTLQGGGTGLFQKAFFGTGAVVKAGSGVWTLSGTNTHGGTTTVSNGTLRINGVGGTNLHTVLAGATLGGSGVIPGAVASEGTVAPGVSAGILVVGRDYTETTGSVFAVELGGNVAGVSHDELVVSNAATLAGSLSVTLIGGFVPATNDVFLILDAGTVAGTFSSASLPSLPAGQGWEIQYLSGEVLLSITSAPAITGYDLAATAITNGLSGYNDDADGDGYANLLEYVTGGSLTNADTNARMSGGRTNNVLALKFFRDTAATDATLYVEGSYTATNNADWVGIATNIGGSWGGSPTNVTESGASPVNVTVQDTEASATNRFLRLRVTRP